MLTHGPPRLIRTLAAALTLTALAVATAKAQPALDWSDPSPSATKPPAPTVTRAIDHGIDWGSAAIGAGAATGALLLAAAGATAASHRHHHVRSPR